MATNTNQRMRYILPIIISLCATFGVAAKKNKPRAEYPRAEIKVGYDYFHKFLYNDGTCDERTTPMMLLANGLLSKYYSADTEWKDSLESTPSGRALRDKMLSEAMRIRKETGNDGPSNDWAYKTQLYVFKDKTDCTITVYDKSGFLAHGTYTEPIGTMEWEIGDSIKNILGYDCIMATTYYHGRRWTAWLTPEIPLADGPWKLGGLPGLILEAYEPSDQHHFTATGIEATDQKIVPMIWTCHNYEKTTRLEMLKDQRSAKSNANAMIKASIGLDLGPDAHLAPETTSIDFLETDYH